MHSPSRELDAITSGGPAPEDGLVAAWDFADGIGPRGIAPTGHGHGPHALHGTCVNFPARGMTGWNWRASRRSSPGARGVRRNSLPRRRPRGLPAGRRTSRWIVPDDCSQRRLRAPPRPGEAEEWIPFFVLPPRGTPTAKACSSSRPRATSPTRTSIVQDVPVAQSILGQTSVDRRAGHLPLRAPGVRSLDLRPAHPTAAACTTSSRLRPIIEHAAEAPECGARASGSSRRICIWLTGWTRWALEYDVVTDQELHGEGAALLARYNVVFTGIPPRVLLEPRCSTPGRSTSGRRPWHVSGLATASTGRSPGTPDRPDLMEVRKVEYGSRAWQASPASTTCS